MINTETKEDDEYMFDNLSEYQAFVKNNKRTKLHNKSTVAWLKSRYPDKTKKHYLLFPEELIEDMKIRKIFKIFDKDGSQALDLEEMVEMFQKYNIEIDKEELQTIYAIVDKTKDNALNYLEFKECAISQDANSIFSKMIAKVRHLEEENKAQEERNIYLPQRFSEMVTYLSYRINRDDLEQYLKERSHRISEKYEKYLQLINLNGLDSAGATAHENQIKDQKKLDKASDLEQKIFDRKESSSDSDKDVQEVDKSFRNQIKEEQMKRQQKAQFRLSAATNSLRKQSLVPSSNSPSHRSSIMDNHVIPTSPGQTHSYFVAGAAYAQTNNANASTFEHNLSGSHRGSKMKTQNRSLSQQQQQIATEQEEIIQTKFTKFEASNLSKKAQVKGASDAQELFEQVNKQYGSSNNFTRTFYSTRDLWRTAKSNGSNSSSKFKVQTTDSAGQLSPQDKSSEREAHAASNYKFFGAPKGSSDFESTQNSQKSVLQHIYGVKEKFSNDTFRNVDWQGASYQQHKNNNNLSTQAATSRGKTSFGKSSGSGWHRNMNSQQGITQRSREEGMFSRENMSRGTTAFGEGQNRKFNSTAYTLGRRPKTNHMTISQMGVDKSSFKTISSIMNRTLQQLENKRSQRNLFLSVLPPSQRFPEKENKVKSMSQKLFAQSAENNVIDPKLIQSMYKPNQVQEYQDREKQLINEIKQDIMDKFLMNNKVAASLYDDAIVNSTMQPSDNQPPGFFKITEQPFQRSHKQKEIEFLSRLTNSRDRDRSPQGNIQRQEFSTTAGGGGSGSASSNSKMQGHSGSSQNINFRIKNFQPGAPQGFHISKP